MKKIRKLVFATNNPHKLQEARQIISDSFEIVSLADIGCHDEIPETADTLEGNSLIKARWVKERYGYDCFADDTGLMVDALDGAPGVLSARYAGEHCSPADNVALLLSNMKGRSDRKASFATVVSLISGEEEYTFEGRVDGEIAEAPHGNGGFGYDPVFIAKESGKCFAEMTADEKNAISHRGRALRKLRDFLGILLFVIMASLPFLTVNAQQWRLHPSYDGQMERIIDTPDCVYFLGTKQEYNPNVAVMSELHGVLFRYDKQSDELEYLNSLNLLSGNTVRCASYNYDKRYLAVAFDDGNIDMIYDDGTVKSVPGLKVADSSLDKTVNDITFDSKTGKIYLATNFGYVVIDDGRMEIASSKVFNEKCNSVAAFKGKVWVSARNSLFCGEETDFNLSMYEKVAGMANILRLFPISGDDMYAMSKPSDRMILSSMHIDGNLIWASPLVSSELIAVTPGKGAVTAVCGNSIRWYGSAGQFTSYDLPDDYRGSLFSSMSGRDFWVSSGRRGISSLRVPAAEGGNWTVLKDKFFPNASTAFQSSSMAYHPEFGMLVRNHGYEEAFNGRCFTTYDLISGYKDMNWTPLSTTYRTDMSGLLIDNPFGLAVDPNNANHVYCGSERSGLLRLDLKNPTQSIHMSKPSDMLGGNGKPGFVAIVPDNNPNTTWGEQCVFAAPQFDNAGNMWTAFVNPETGNGQYVSSYTELWVWPPSARAASTSANNVQGWVKLKIDNLQTANNPVVLPLKASVNKNIVLHSGNTVASSMLVLNHNGTIDNQADDKTALVKNLYDQDGETINFVKVFDWYEEPSTGMVWVSYGGGIFTFNPSEAFSNPTAARRIKVARNDGTNLADYLLEEIQVNCITADPQGRKWFATTGAGLVCTTSDGREILNTYTPDNSSLPGSTVYSLCYNPSNNSMMVSTDQGLCELFLSGASGLGETGVRAYPNPVRPDYFGYVNIDGLQQNAMVKVVDTAGNLIKECGLANNGLVQWDMTNLNMKRVPGGIYYIMASNGPSADSYAEVAKVLVVN